MSKDYIKKRLLPTRIALIQRENPDGRISLIPAGAKVTCSHCPGVT
jgi:hypothetical protein